MRVTLKDIADRVGVSHSTVSRALRDHPRISLKTRNRIQALAKELGYRPDPALSALAAYRAEKTPLSNYGKIAILTHKSVGDTVKGHLSEHIEGIRDRADKVGFQAEVFQLEPDAKQQRHIRKTLFHRGIQGLIVLPMPWQPVHFDWGAFAIVGMGENAVPLHLNYVCYDHDAAVQETYSRLRERGYRRIGFFNNRKSEERNRMLFVSAYLKCLYQDGVSMIPPLLHEEGPEGFLSWTRKHHLDAVIGHPWSVLPLLKDTPLADPERFGVAGFATSLDRLPAGSFATYVIDGQRLGALAVDFLQNMLHKNQYGVPVPETQHAILARGYWRDGDSIRPSAGKAKKPKTASKSK